MKMNVGACSDPRHGQVTSHLHRRLVLGGLVALIDEGHKAHERIIPAFPGDEAAHAGSTILFQTLSGT